MANKLDIVIFGATGITGQYVIPQLARLSKEKSRNLTWGVAGRSVTKLKDTLNQCEGQCQISLSTIPIIRADVTDQKSLNDMVRQARVIINCCGPFRFFGESVIKACLEEGTHHIDVSGEMQFIEEMQLKYHKKAQEKGVYIISSCGYESIPIDLGIVFLEENFTGTLNSVETYLKYTEEGGSFEGSACHYGTWESAVYVLAHSRELRQIRRKLFSNKLPKFEPKLRMNFLPWKSDVGWTFPFDSTDGPVVKRTQRYFYERELKRPIQIESYIAVKSLTTFIQLLFYGLIVLVFSKFSFGVNLLLKYPEKLSAGFFSRNPPNEERVKRSKFCIYLCGKGWKNKLSDANTRCSTPPDQNIIAKVEGRNPIYGTTATCLVCSAITIATETDKLPPGGGVYPPGYAFAKTSLVQQLMENEVKFQIIKDKDK